MSIPDNNRAALDAAMTLLLHSQYHRRRASERGRYRDVKLHSLLLGWSDPDQVLRVAAGIPGKRASDGLWPSGHCFQGCGAFPTRYRTWEPQPGVELELEDMVKTN